MRCSSSLAPSGSREGGNRGELAIFPLEMVGSRPERCGIERPSELDRNRAACQLGAR